MNDAAIKKWTDALRSGKYKQAKGSLHDEDSGGYCCLGVAVDVYNKEFNREDPIRNSTLAGYPEVRAWLGLADEEGRFRLSDSETGPFGDGTDYLTCWNDEERPFDEIAALIDSRPEGMFE